MLYQTQARGNSKNDMQINRRRGQEKRREYENKERRDVKKSPDGLTVAGAIPSHGVATPYSS